MIFHIKNAGILAAAVGLAWLLGWSMRGDTIYSAMFERTVSLMPNVK